MRVAIVGPYPKDRDRIGGGVPGATLYLIDALRKEPGVELIVVVPQSGVGPTSCEERDGITVHRVGKRRGWSVLPGTFYDLCVGRRQIRELLVGLAPDIAHFQTPAFLAAGYRGPSVLTMHGIAERDAFLDRRWGLLWPLQWLLLRVTEEHGRKRVKHVILISDYAGTQLPSNGTRRSWRINNAIADSFFDVPRRLVPGRILCCSRLFPLKNITGLIAAFAIVARSHPDAELRLAGSADPAYLGACEREVQAHGLASRVRFLGNLGIAGIQDELSKAACLALPSIQENAPLAIEEAMAASLPVVASNVGGIPEMVEHGGSGLLVDPRDPSSIANALVAVLSDTALARAMGERGRAIAEARFRPSAVGKLTLQAYAEIVSAGGRAQ